MKQKNSSIFRSISLLIAGLIFILGSLFIALTYFSTLHYYQATTQRLNKDVAAHIAKFTSPFSNAGLNRQIADSVFYDAMILSPSVEVYFLDTTGRVMYFHAPDSAIKVWKVPLAPIKAYIASGGQEYIQGADPKLPGENKIFSAAAVRSGNKQLGYIYVILGGNDYRNVSQLLLGNHVTTLVAQAAAVVLVLSVIVSLLYLRRIKRNLAKVTGVLDAYRAGNYKARFESTAYNEFTPVTTSFNQMADLLTHTIEQLETAAKDRKDFLANISHDLRTPLTVIRGYAETLQDAAARGTLDAGKQADLTSLLHKKIKQLEHMIWQLFELSRMESPEFKPAQEPFNIAELLAETVSSAQNMAAEKNIRLQSSGADETAWVNADPAMMERAIQNLVYNALKHTPENGQVSISLEKATGNIVLVFENSAPPLPPSLLQWINSADIHKTQPMPGRNGLGLAIVKKILQLHRYQLRAENNAAGVKMALVCEAWS